MSLGEYVRVLRSRWYVIVAAVVVGLLLAGIYVGTATKKYTSHAQLFVSTPSSSNLQELGAGGTFAQDQVKSYASVASSPGILIPVIDQLALPYSLDTLESEISASAPQNTVLINVSATDPDPQRSTAIVNAVASRLASYISLLETPTSRGTSPVKATVTRTEHNPGAQSAPKTSLDLALGLVLGMLVGVGAAVALDLLDNRVGGHHDVETVADAPVVGLIGEDKLARTKPLILLDSAFSPRSEAFRRLRTNVRYLGVDHLLRSFVVTGSVENEGKTLTASNLAVTLAQSGERVILIDADLRRPSVAKTFGIPNGTGLTNVLVGTSTVADALQVWRPDLQLAIIAAGPTPPNPSELLGSQRLIDLVRELRDQCDIVIFDSPPLLPVTDAALLARATEGAIVVSRAKSTRIGQLRAACGSLRAADATVLGVVINRMPRRHGGPDGYQSYASYGAYGSYAPIPGQDDVLPASVDRGAPRPRSGTPSAAPPEDAAAAQIARSYHGSRRR